MSVTLAKWRCRILPAVAGASTCVLLASCGGDGKGDDHKSDPVAKSPTPHAAGRFQTPEYAFTSRAEAPKTGATVGGKRLSGRGQLLVLVHVRLENRQPRRMEVGQLNADLHASGKPYGPILAHGREATEPIFEATSVPTSKAISSVLVYRVPQKALAGARLSVTDPLRDQAFKLVLF